MSFKMRRRCGLMQNMSGGSETKSSFWIALALATLTVTLLSNISCSRNRLLNDSPPPMKEGVANEIQYKSPDGSHHIAHLTTTRLENEGLPIEKTIDPVWTDRAIGTGEANNEWLSYVADDGRAWRAKVHCEHPGGSQNIHCWFEHEGNGNNHNDDFMFFKDFNGNNWRADLQRVWKPWPASPTFKLTRIP